MLALAVAALLLGACKSKSQESQSASTDAAQTETNPSSSSATSSESATPAVTTQKVNFSPELVTLGKAKEATIKLLPGTAIDLQTPDGKSEGQEIKFKISVTNNFKIGQNNFGIYPSEFRLVLDDNTAITEESGGSLSVNPESTEESADITYRVPAGKKPKTLNLYYDETRMPVQVSLVD